VNNAPHGVDEVGACLGCPVDLFGGVRLDFVACGAHCGIVRPGPGLGKRGRHARPGCTSPGVLRRCDRARGLGGPRVATGGARRPL
jgi:hypothetical protein